MNLILLYLKSTPTGGLETVNRTLIHTIPNARSPYEPTQNRLRFLLSMFTIPIPDTLLLAHINLAPAAAILKLRRPRLRIVLMAHGIEVWRPLGGLRKSILHKADRILAVSQYTKNQLIARHRIPEHRIAVLPNCLAPDFPVPQTLDKPAYLLERYGLRPHDKVLLTLTRIAPHETRKGYDRVLEALPELPGVHYLLAGKYDPAEYERLQQRIRALGLEHRVRLPGYIPPGEITDHYCLADLYVMPSTKEGFGLAFIEAMACGAPALGGNRDGSTEALHPLGHTVDPEDTRAIAEKIREILADPPDRYALQQAAVVRFGYDTWRRLLFTRAKE